MNDTMQARRPNGRSPAERLELLLLSHGLEDEALQAFCRSRGIFPRHLQQWHADFAQAQEARQERAEVRTLKAENQSLQRELRRKDKALAEAAALLVLQKKFQTLLAGEVA